MLPAKKWEERVVRARPRVHSDLSEAGATRAATELVKILDSDELGAGRPRLPSPLQVSVPAPGPAQMAS